ncbi:biopolymer transport protein ExbD [Caulobacter ginsengisoli]|uniref:Biopolymer transport protein ExbD n=1 Tax=Caulobacter ginsengisoli TaxID=400775 RepID=A0ABU0IWT4_9CAUL|nr:biopolymer transporter ExbD [Caulobacter ginsengisoli]MDQ0466481.1 biopolymer transport protein ExbD [Caulobacter ginsengisoli]
MAGKVAGGKKNKFDLGQNSDMNVTPFVDVMLVLLIIFMVTAPLATVSIQVDLPPAVPPDANDHKKPVFISLQPGGHIFFGGKETSLAALPTDIPIGLLNNGDTGPPTEQRIFIQSNPDVLYEQFMSVLNVLQGNGYFKVGLILEEVN